MLPRRFTAAGASLFARAWIRETVWTLATGFIALLVAIVTYRLWWADKQSPFWGPSGDGLGIMAMVKAVTAHRWYWHIPELGAPYGLNLADFSSVYGDWLHVALIKGLTLFSHDTVLVTNTYLIAGFSLA